MIGAKLRLFQPNMRPKVRFKLGCSWQDAGNKLYAIYTQLVYLKSGSKPDKMCLKYIEKVAKWITSPTAKDSLMIVGGVGNGKTTLAKSVAILFNEVNNCDWWVTQKTSKELYDEFEQPNKNDYKHSLLIIDDLGVEPIEKRYFGNISTPLIDVLSYRYNRNIPIIITTNLDFEDKVKKGNEIEKSAIEHKYDLRIKDRLQEMCEVLFISEKSYRA